MKQPSGFIEGDEEILCKLNRIIYGLKQTANVWKKALNNVLIDGGFIQSKADPCLYHKVVNGEDVYLLVYVDALVVGAKNGQQIKCIYSMLNRKFEVNDFGVISHYLGMQNIRTDAFNYKMRQNQYIENVLK